MKRSAALTAAALAATSRSAGTADSPAGPLGLFDGGLVVGALPRLRSRPAGLVERAPERVVERAQPDLVAGRDCLRRADQVRAGATLLGGDDRPQDPFDRGVEAFDDRVVLVEPASGRRSRPAAGGARRARRAADCSIASQSTSP